jgi:hypothetical protein
MGSAGIGLIAFACLFGTAMLGMFLRSRLPEHHQSAETQRIVKLATGIIGTMAALVLGLLVASAKNAYDTQRNELTAMAAKIVLLDRALAVYGPDAQGSRDQLRRLVHGFVEQVWPNEQRFSANPDQMSTAGLALFVGVQKLSPQDEIQRSIKAQAIAMVVQIAEQRFLIIEQKQSSVSKPLLVILIFSLAINFFSFGLFAPRNGTVIAALCLCAMASAGAIFLILELYNPYGGLIQIPSATLQNALGALGP